MEWRQQDRRVIAERFRAARGRLVESPVRHSSLGGFVSEDVIELIVVGSRSEERLLVRLMEADTGVE